MSRQALILFAHGARDPEWARPFEAIRELVAARRPDVAVELAYLELMTPQLAEAVERVAKDGTVEITVAPLFMAQGGHLRQDVPRLLAEIGQRHPGVAIRLLPAVGEIEGVLAAIASWLVASVPPA